MTKKSRNRRKAYRVIQRAVNKQIDDIFKEGWLTEPELKPWWVAGTDAKNEEEPMRTETTSFKIIEK